MKRLTYIYFSATTTTAQCAKAVGQAMSLPIEREINIADNHSTELPFFEPEDVVVIASPVYGGRVPTQMVNKLKRLKGKGAHAVALVVYGNRNYDDALLELTNLLSESGFNILGAGAFIGQHSIFPKVAVNRPDKSDMEALTSFGAACNARLDIGAPFQKIKIPGNFPYKDAMGVPFHPKADSDKCKRCSACADKCPVGAINSDNPVETDSSKCIACGRCIVICPRKARDFGGVIYRMMGKVFVATYSKRKEPEWSVAL